MTDASPPTPTPADVPAPISLHKPGDPPTRELGRVPATPPTPEVRTLQVEFSGDAREYFRIWIVNVALSVVTLGLYSPWARVRTRQYFYGHTRLEGHPFEYTAQPLALLRSFLIVAALFVVYTLSQQLPKFQWVSFVMIALFGLAYPWLVYRSLRFNAANTVYRGLNFRFHGTPGAAYVAYLFIMLTLPFTGGLTYPLARWMQHRYILQGLAYGTTRARWNKDVGPVYVAYLKGVGVAIGVGVLAVLAVLLLVWTLGSGLNGDLSDLLDVVLLEVLSTGSYVAVALGFGALYLGYILLVLGVGQYLHAAVLRYSLDGLYFGETLRLHTTFRPSRLAWIHVTNTLAQLFTLGLLTPWAVVRRTRYLLDGVQVQTIADLDHFSADSTPTESALGEAAHEFFNFDLGF
ncbi:YjgN family protein [Deinococcus aquiradiocola]|uniref:DUF898 domain-containing protein n=1 Tax=Deinococcus aquiradiocola TaxID=393059 RepID=A0A917P5P3_9DEIO|nr:YjgN family protein [Deinococcus aquiradiocola]GGJ62606.1 hypothetical protein GCM10008939_03030 [Deinococcus aquiradiocola]